MKKITVQELKATIDAKTSANILDIRTLREYIDFRIKNIPFIPLELLSHIKPKVIWNKAFPVYVISYTEKRSKEFCSKLGALGYSTFYLEEGGIEAWCRQNLSVINTSEDIQDSDRRFMPALSVTNNMKSRPALNFEILIKQHFALGHYFREIIGIAWFFEKMNCNVKFVFKEGHNYFENSILKVSKESLAEKFISLRLNMREFDCHCMHIPSEYAYSVISRLSIKQDIQKQADKWVHSNLTGNWIGVHFRGTDLVVRKRRGGFVGMDTYIYYLKRIINKHCNIFVCTDQAQFIDLMHDTFPGRVFSRGIQRAYDNRKLHRSPEYAGLQQRIDALMDILILSKAGMVYKTAGEFSCLTRFFNPSVKIISVIWPDRRYCKHHPENFIRPPIRIFLLTSQSFLRYVTSPDVVEHNFRKLCSYFRRILTLS